MKHLYLLSLIIISLSTPANSAKSEEFDSWAVNLKYFGLTYHPGGGSSGSSAYPLQIDKEGYFVLQIGAETDLDYYLNEHFLIRTTAAAFKDCAMLWSGHFHLGFRGNYSMDNGLSFRFGVGPTLIWRENWYKEPLVNDWYNGDGFYGREKHNRKFQTAFIWYGGNFEVDYKINQDMAFVYSLIPGYPQVFTSSFGLRTTF